MLGVSCREVVMKAVDKEEGKEGEGEDGVRRVLRVVVVRVVIRFVELINRQLFGLGFWLGSFLGVILHKIVAESRCLGC